MKYLFIIVFLSFIISCETQTSLLLSDNPDIKKIFSPREIEDLETLNSFFNSQICGESGFLQNKCFISFFQNMNANNKLGHCRLNIDYKAQKSIYNEINESTFNEIWSFSTNMHNDSIGQLVYNREGKFLTFIKDAAKEDTLVKDYLEAFKEGGDIYCGMIESYNFKENESQNFRFIIAIHYLTLNDKFERK